MKRDSTMRRRDFLVASTTSTLMTTTTLSPSHGGELSGIITKAIKYHNVDAPDLSIEDKFRLVKDAGFDGIELRTTHQTDQRQFIAASEKVGLPIHGVINGSSADLKSPIEFCAAVGGSGILITAPYDRKRPLMESWKERQDIIRAALPHAEKHRVKILVENVWAGFLISALDAQRFVDEINHPQFGCYFDVGNNVRWGVPEHWIEILGSRIGKLDIKEWDETLHQKEGLRKGFTRQIGSGTIQWGNVRKALLAIGYSGWATAEVGNADRERLLDIAQRMDQVLDLA